MRTVEAASLFYYLNRTGFNGLCRFNSRGEFNVPFTQYSRAGFSWDDQARAVEWLARREGPVVLSNQATPRVVALYGKLGYDIP